MRRSIPVDYYKNLYSALFESHLSYGISVWGVALKPNSTETLFKTQKQCIRVLFGDLSAYLNKNATCARVREFGHQKLGSSFYTKEHTKPIFDRLKIMTVQSLHKYHSLVELFKILKFRIPYSLYDLITMSNRETSNLIILPKQSLTFIYESSKMWNSLHKSLINHSTGFSTSVTLVKQRIKNILFASQALHDINNWTSDNFKIKPPNPLYPNYRFPT